MDNLYVLKTNDGKWEEVDEYIYKNHKAVVNDKNIPRYCGNRFSVEDETVKFDNLTVNVDELGMIARISGARIPTGSNPAGFAPKPIELLRIKRGRGMIFYEMQTGNKFKLAS